MNFLEYKKTLKTCAACPKMCAYLCPPFRYSRDERQHHTGSSRLALQGMLSRMSVYQCSGCEQCQEICALKVPVLERLFKERSLLWQSGDQPEQLVRMTDNLLSYGHPFHQSRAQLQAGGKVLFTDCVTEHFLPHLLGQLSWKVERKLPGTRWEGGFCCGFFLLAAGAGEAFVSYARRQGKLLLSYDEIFMAGSECAYCLKVLYKEKAGVDLSRKVKDAFPEWTKGANGLKHRSCYAIKAFGPIESLKLNGNRCAGAGSFAFLLSPDFVRAMAREWAYAFEQKRVITDCAAAKASLRESTNFRFYLEL